MVFLQRRRSSDSSSPLKLFFHKQGPFDQIVLLAISNMLCQPCGRPGCVTFCQFDTGRPSSTFPVPILLSFSIQEGPMFVGLFCGLFVGNLWHTLDSLFPNLSHFGGRSHPCRRAHTSPLGLAGSVPPFLIFYQFFRVRGTRVLFFLPS